MASLKYNSLSYLKVRKILQIFVTVTLKNEVKKQSGPKNKAVEIFSHDKQATIN